MAKFTPILTIKSIITEFHKVELCNKYQKNKMFLSCNSPKKHTIGIIEARNAEDFYYLQETFP